MRFITVTLASALLAVATAQDVGALPECSRSCVGASFGDCGPIDIKCICSNTALISDLSCCVAQRCNAADQQATIDFAVNLCKTYQIQVPTSASCPAGGASSTAPPSESSSAPAGGAGTGTTAATPSGSSAPGNGTGGGTGGNGPSASPPAPTGTGAAGKLEAGMGVGALLAGALLML